MSGGPYYGEGVYRCRVTDQGFETSGGGHPMIVFRISPEWDLNSHGASGTAEETRVQSWPRTSRLVIVPDNPASLNYAIQKLRHAGFTGGHIDELNFVGELVVFRCEHREYQGKVREQWDLALPAPASEPLGKNLDVKRRLGALFGRALKEGAKTSSRPSPPPASHPDDDDIPF